MTASFQLNEMTMFCAPGISSQCLELLQSKIEHSKLSLGVDFRDISSYEWKEVEEFVEDSKCLTLNKHVRVIPVINGTQR